LEPECPLSYGNIRVFSIFRLRVSSPYAIVIHGRKRAQGPNPRRSENHPTDGNTHQRITTMAAMKKKKKAKKAAKK
jgi:hypothetical protein